MFHGKKYVFTKPTDVDMLLMLEKGIRGETCYTINRYSEHERRSCKYRIFIFHILGYQKIVWMVDVTKVVCESYRIVKIQG